MKKPRAKNRRKLMVETRIGKIYAHTTDAATATRVRKEVESASRVLAPISRRADLLVIIVFSRNEGCCRNMDLLLCAVAIYWPALAIAGGISRQGQHTFIVIAKLSGAKVPVTYIATILSSRDLDFSVHDPWMGHHLRKSQAFRWIQPKHALQKISSLVA